jgi:hypothetical protein
MTDKMAMNVYFEVLLVLEKNAVMMIEMINAVLEALSV